jgi:3-phenylpropionate/cinnamic acid dioxygenase small subunit
MPPSKRRRPSRADTRLALHKRVTRIRTEMSALKRDRAAVKRHEFDDMTASLRQLQKNTDDLAEHTKNLATQLTRMAQIQQEVDEIKRTLKKAKLD